MHNKYQSNSLLIKIVFSTNLIDEICPPYFKRKTWKKPDLFRCLIHVTLKMSLYDNFLNNKIGFTQWVIQIFCLHS